MLDFLSEKERTILSVYPFIKEFCESKNPERLKDKFRTNLDKFGPEMLDSGISKDVLATLEIKILFEKSRNSTPLKQTNMNQAEIHGLTLILNDVLTIVSAAKDGYHEMQVLEALLAELLNKAIEICGRSIHYRKVKPNILINHYDVLITDFETIMHAESDIRKKAGLIKKTVARTRKDLEYLGDHNFTLYHGFGNYALESVRKNGLQAPRDTPIDPDKYSDLRANYVFFTLLEEDAVFYAHDASRQFHFYSEIERLHNKKVDETGKGEKKTDVYRTYFEVSDRTTKIAADEFTEKAEEDGGWGLLTPEEIEQVHNDADDQKGYIAVLKHPNRFRIKHYRAEGSDAGEHIIEDAVPIEELEIRAA